MKKLDANNLEWQSRFTYQKNILFDEGVLRQKGAKFQIVKFASNTQVSSHVHKKVCEIFYILKGSGIFIFNKIPERANIGTVFLCEPGDVHAIHNDTEEELIILIFKTNEDPEDIRWLDS